MVTYRVEGSKSVSPARVLIADDSRELFFNIVVVNDQRSCATTDLFHLSTCGHELDSIDESSHPVKFVLYSNDVVMVWEAPRIALSPRTAMPLKRDLRVVRHVLMPQHDLHAHEAT